MEYEKSIVLRCVELDKCYIYVIKSFDGDCVKTQYISYTKDQNLLPGQEVVLSRFHSSKEFPDDLIVDSNDIFRVKPVKTSKIADYADQMLRIKNIEDMMQLSIITANAKDLIKEINQVTGKHFDSLDDTKKYGDMLAEFNEWYQKQIRSYAEAANNVVLEAAQVADIPYRIDVGYEAFDEPDNSFSEVEYADINTQIAKSKEIYSWSVLQKFFNKEASLLGNTKKFLDSNKPSKML